MDGQGLTAPIKVTVLTGFLGAGKTTLLNRLMADPAVRDTGVIVNEFGEVAIDHLLVETTAADGVIELSDGCLCCTVRGELADTLADLVDRIQTGRLAPLKRVVVETTGLADPTPILAMLMGHPALLQAYALDGVVAVVDAVDGAGNIEAREEARRQVAVADRIVLTKRDIASEAAARAVTAAVRRINPRAPILDTMQGEAEAGRLFDCGLFDPATKSPDVLRWLQAEAHAASHGDHAGHDHGSQDHHHGSHDHSGAGSGRHGDIRSFSIVHEPPVLRAAVEGFLELLRQTGGGRLLRMKAVIRTMEQPDRPLVLHGVRSFLHPPVRLKSWPAGMRPSSRLVMIGENLDEAYVRDLFAAFAGVPGADRPDAEGLLANPLAVPGHSFG